MLDALERMRLVDTKGSAKESNSVEEWDTGGKSDFQVAHLPAKALGKGYTTLSRRIGRVRTGDWGTNSGKKKASSSKKADLI
jgi:WD repeat-containing protein 59